MKTDEYLEFNEVEIKKSKIVGGLTGEAKQLVDKFSRAAKEKGQPFTDFESEGLLYVTFYDKNNLVYCIPIFSFKDNKKIDLKEIMLSNMQKFSLKETEDIFFRISKKELKHIEIIGGILGGIIAVFQFFIMLFVRQI